MATIIIEHQETSNLHAVIAAVPYQSPILFYGTDIRWEVLSFHFHGALEFLLLNHDYQ